MNQMNCLKTDPMKNDLILERIFQFCDVPSLKSCRLVCPKWRDLSLKSWRSKAVLQLATWPHEERLDSGEFVELLQSNPDSEEGPFQLRKYPFKRYSFDLEKCAALRNQDQNFSNKPRLVAMTMGHWGLRHVQLIWGERFWGFRPLLAILTLNCSLKSIEVNLQTLSYDISKSLAPLEFRCHHVKRLKIFARHLTWEHSVERSMWPFLLDSCPNLEALSVGYNFREEDGSSYYTTCLLDRIKLTKLLRDIRLSGDEKYSSFKIFEIFPLKELEMIDCHSMQRDGNPGEATVIRQLAECKFPLQRLSYHCGYFDCQDEDIVILILNGAVCCKKRSKRIHCFHALFPHVFSNFLLE